MGRGPASDQSSVFSTGTMPSMWTLTLVTGLPVIVISKRAAERLVQLPPEGKLTYPFRLLHVRTVSGTSMMTIFHPDSVCVKTPEGWQRVETLLGVSPEGYDGFQALVPASLMASDLAATM